MAIVTLFTILFQFVLIVGKWLPLFLFGFLLYWWGLGRIFRRRVDTLPPQPKQ